MMNNTREQIFSALLTLLSSPLTPTGTTHSTTTIDNISNMAGVIYGAAITGSGIPAGTIIVGVGSNSVTLSQAATTSGTNVVLSIQPYKTMMRRALGPSQIKQEQRPALLLIETTEERTPTFTGRPQEMTLDATVLIYVWTKGYNEGGPPPITILNPLIDALDLLLAPDAVLWKAPTLSGKVNRVWIEGQIFKISGDLDGDSIAVVPLKLLVPA